MVGVLLALLELELFVVEAEPPSPPEGPASFPSFGGVAVVEIVVGGVPEGGGPPAVDAPGGGALAPEGWWVGDRICALSLSRSRPGRKDSSSCSMRSSVGPHL